MPVCLFAASNLQKLEAKLGTAKNQVPTKYLRKPRHRTAWVWGISIFLLLCAGGSIVAFRMVIKRARPILKGRVIETLSARFKGNVELDTFEVSVGSGLNVSGSGLRIYAPDALMAAGVTAPLIAVKELSFRAALRGLFLKPTYIDTVYVRGLAINVPPREMRGASAGQASRRLGKVQIKVNQIICEDSLLTIGTAKPDKDPKIFELKHIVLHDVGPNASWPFDAFLTNPVPAGEIHTNGTFGPWDTDSPGDTGVNGKYTFERADLNTIKGIAGILQSAGTFGGELDRIAVQGQTEVPDFSLDTANHPMPLTTHFEAIVDGTSGDTLLSRVDAVLGSSKFSCKGAIVNEKGKGHHIGLDVDVPAGRIADFLRLAVKSEPPAMTGIVSLKSTLEIRPGKERVIKKMRMKGTFALQGIHFTDPDIEDKVDVMSLRAQGKTSDIGPGAPDVKSKMTGDFEMRDNKLTFRNLDYSLPGGEVQLAGAYALEGREYDFTGKVRTDARLSQMVASKWKSILLKPVDPFFHKNGAGAEIPIHVSGANGKPKVGVKF
jgi:hypothetical protein